MAKRLLYTDIHMTEKFNGVVQLCICDFELKSYNEWLVSADSHSTLLMKSLSRTDEKKIRDRLNSLKMAPIHAKMHRSGN